MPRVLKRILWHFRIASAQLLKVQARPVRQPAALELQDHLTQDANMYYGLGPNPGLDWRKLLASTPLCKLVLQCFASLTSFC